MADETPTALPPKTYDYAPVSAHASGSTGLSFWASFALVSVIAFGLLTQLAAA